MKASILRFWPIFAILFIFFIFSSPYFIKSQVPYPATFQNSFFSPWSSYDKYAVPVKNNALSDVVTQIYPWKHFTIEELKKGNIPWWNPYSFSGNPHLANFQAAVFSPFNLLFFILPFIDAWSLLILLQPLLAGLFTYLFLRKLKISKAGSLLGSITFMFCGFFVVWMPYGTLSMAIAFLPLALYAIEKSFEKAKLFPLILLPATLILSFFSGHFQISLYLSAYTFCFLIFKSISTKNKKTALKILAAFIFGIIISLIQIIPSLDLYKHSVRSDLFSNQGAIPVSYLITAIAPDFFGNPVTRNDWLSNYAEWASFIGIIPFTLALISLLKRKNKDKKLFFLFTGIGAVVLSLDTPLQALLANLKLPVFSTSIPSRIIVLFSFSFAVLAAYGLDSLKEFLEKKELKKIIILLLVEISFILIIYFALFILKIIPHEKTIIAARNLIIPTVLLILSSVLIILNLKIKWKLYVPVLLSVLILFTLTDSLRFAQKWVPFDAKELVFPDVPVISTMQKEIDNGRVYGKFGSYIDTYYRLPSIEGYDPLYSKRYGEFLTSAKTGSYQPAIKSLAVLDKNTKYADRVLDILGVSVIFHVIGDTGKEWAYPVWKKDENNNYLYSVIYQDDKFQLYKNSRALPRAKLFYNYEIIKEDKKIIKRFYSDKFDFRNTLILEEDPGIKAKTFPSIKSEAKITSYNPTKVTINTNSPQPALLFLSDNYYPKWKAKVNGKEARILRADYTLRAVPIPAGHSNVEFYYTLL